ncbi:MAG: YggT family protein [Gemmatimonadaceae bacterium]
METFIALFDAGLRMLRPVFFVAAAVLAVICVFDWMVRTRRINPFSRGARFARDTLDPLFKPVERRIARTGGNPVTAPFWTLAAAVLGGIVVLSVLEFTKDQIAMAAFASQSGLRGFGRILLRWMFQILRLALIVRVVCSWIQVSPYSRWVRWAFVLTEPILRPLRQIIPTLGMVDITPIVAWFALTLLEGVLT